LQQLYSNDSKAGVMNKLLRTVPSWPLWHKHSSYRRHLDGTAFLKASMPLNGSTANICTTGTSSPGITGNAGQDCLSSNFSRQHGIYGNTEMESYTMESSPRKNVQDTYLTLPFKKNTTLEYKPFHANTGYHFVWTETELLAKSVKFKKWWLLNVETAQSSSAQSMGLSYKPERQALQQWMRTGCMLCLPSVDPDNPKNLFA
jgi:hypothetical protein